MNFPSLVKKSQQVFIQVTLNLSQENRSSQAHSSVSILPGDRIRPEILEVLRHQFSKRLLHQQSGLPCRIQASERLMQPQDQFPRPCQVQGGALKALCRSDKISWDTEKLRSKCPAQIPPGREEHYDVGQSVRRILKDLYLISANPPVNDPRVKPESES